MNNFNQCFSSSKYVVRQNVWFVIIYSLIVKIPHFSDIISNVNTECRGYWKIHKVHISELNSGNYKSCSKDGPNTETILKMLVIIIAVSSFMC